MPSTIPYDPVLALGSVVSMQRLDILQQIAAVQAPVYAAQDMVNSLNATKRSLDMTSRELADMGIDTTEIDRASAALSKDVASATQRLTELEAAAINAIAPLQANMARVSDSVESPVDYNRTSVKQMPLPADGLRMTAQYFSFDQSSQAPVSHTAKIASFISDGAGVLGEQFASKAIASATRQVDLQVAEHSIVGTLVISITCLHKNAVLLTPLVLHPDKGISVFNTCFPDSKIKTDSVSSVLEVVRQADTVHEEALTIVSGATLGSCFIGLVHVLKTSGTRSDEVLESIASSLQTRFTVGGWFEHISGGVGVRSSFTEDAKALLSAQNVTSHCSFTTAGTTPAIEIHQLKTGANPFSNLDTSLVSGKTGSDNTADEVIDFNSLMASIDEYIHHCVAGHSGTPVHYYLKPVNASQLAKEWIARHSPDQFINVAIDDSSFRHS